MGFMSSCIEKIDAVRFERFPPKRVVNNLRVVAIGHALYGLGPKGTIYTTGELAGKVCYTGTASDYHAVLALRAFGLITADEAKRHGESKRLQDKAFDDYRAVNCEIERLTSAGIRLTKAQKSALEEMRKALDVKRLPYFIKADDVKKTLAKKFN